MKQKTIELEVDFIGEQRSLTPEEEKILTDFFAAQKLGKESKSPVGPKSKTNVGMTQGKSASNQPA